MPASKNPLGETVRRLRLDLGDTQQEFANRLGLAISTVVRYELSRPPRGKALAQLERVAMDHGLDECALTFRNALREELGLSFQGDQVRLPAAGEVGFAAWPQTPEEEAMVFDVLAVMREAQRSHEPAIKETALLMKATRRARATRIEGVELGQAQEDLDAAIVRLHKLGMSNSEITDRLNLSGHRVWTSGKPIPRVEAVLAEYRSKKAAERKSK